MPPNFFQKPETALKRAQELIQVGKESDALDTLHDTIKARRYKQWTQTHEQIMMKHVELCVVLKKPHVAKDALFQYKTLTHQVAVKSLETVIEHFLQMAEQKTEEAQKTSIEKVEEIDDLDQGDVPETLLLSVVSGAAAQDRMDRTVLAPWLRFLWDSYRNCLELLRNNAQVEHLYHRITRKSFQFCSKYQRRTEFRKLCELLRLHLNQIQKHQHLAHVVKLSSPESLSMMQETRLCQLDTAIQMELWQEAYRSAEDVHGMMQLSKDKDKRMVKPASYVNYYDKLALVFWKAGNSLFHAAALLQKFIIYKDMKRSFTADEAQEQASRVLLATLSIPDGADAPSDLTRHLDIEDQHLTNIRLLSNLLRLPIAPTRAGLLREAARLGVPEMASESTNALYKLLENNFAPLRLAREVEAQLALIDRPDHLQYIDALNEVVATKALKQISVIYDSISWSRIRKIIPFYNEMELERLVVDVSKHRFVKAQIDHRSGCIRFGAADATLAGGVDLEEANGFTGDDTQLGVEGIRTHLEVMYNKLRSTVELLDSDKRREALIARVKHHAINYERTKNSKQETDRILERRRKIEYYKETSERVKAERSQQAAAELAKREEAKRAEEMKRLEQENIESEKRRRQAEQEEVQRKIKQDQLRRMQNTAIYQAIIREKGEQVFKDMDPEAVLREQRQRLDKERMETQRRLQQQDKTFDHQVRAIHLEEMLERKAIMMKRLQEAPKLHEKYEQRRIQKAIDDHNQAVSIWERLEDIREDAMDWIDQVKSSNAEDFAKKTADWNSKLNAVRAARLQERAENRKKERREKWIRAKLDEERRRREEEERQRQLLIEEQRRAAREPRGPTRREMDMDSKAMADSDWRGGGRERPVINRPIPSRDRDFGERPPMRERENIISQADRDDSWRRGMGAPAPSEFRERPTPAPPTSIADKDISWRSGMGREPPPVSHPTDGPMRRAPPVSSAPSEGMWTRGNVVKKEPPPSNVPAPSKPMEGGKFIPSRLRNQAQQGMPPRDMGTTRPETRRPAPRGSGAESDTNWRRK
uniref:Eukaryotic translation initiation factor 3 subunit A n=5 Tax=Trichostrongylidae TaxID=6315 RepID=A0A7I5E9A5_HAECO